MDLSTLVAPTFALVGVLSGSVMTHRLSTRRFIGEKVWERRRESYSQVVSVLLTMMEKSTRLAEGYDDDAVQFHESKYSDRLNTEMWDAWRSAKDHFSAGILIVSDDFRSEFTELAKSLNETTSDPNEIVPIWIHKLRDTIAASLNKLTEIAKHELTGSKYG